MKKIIVWLVGFLILVPRICLAQDTSADSLPPKAAGAVGIVAMFPGIFKMSDLDFPRSYEVGVCWHAFDFLTLGLMISYNLTNSDSSTGTYSGRQVFGGGIDVSFLFIRQPRILLYAGIGGRTYYGDYLYNDNSVLFISGQLELGVQVDLFQFLSVFAETGAEFNYKRELVNAVITNTYGVCSLGAVIGIIFYIN